MKHTLNVEQVRRKIETFYNHTTSKNLKERVAEFYAKEVTFQDPLTELKGIEPLTRYYTKLFRHLISLNFEITKVQFDDKDAFATWHMTLRHKRLNGGKPIHVPGVSHFVFEQGLATYHRDYFDVSLMIYEQLPVVGRVVHFLKQQSARF